MTDMTTNKLTGAAGTDVRENEIVVTRIFDAPRDLVWKAWTDPQQMMRWWSPKDYTTQACKIDLRVGGTYLTCMRSDKGQDVWTTGVYKEIVRPERIVCTDSFADEHGNVVPAAYYGMTTDPPLPLELLVTVIFEEYGPGKTRLILRHSGLPAGEMREGTQTGWNEMFDKLSEILR
jgi:uncharacterized protein YndB with AHSA1/START domain